MQIYFLEAWTPYEERDFFGPLHSKEEAEKEKEAFRKLTHHENVEILELSLDKPERF